MSSRSSEVFAGQGKAGDLAGVGLGAAQLQFAGGSGEVDVLLEAGAEIGDAAVDIDVPGSRHRAVGGQGPAKDLQQAGVVPRHLEAGPGGDPHRGEVAEGGGRHAPRDGDDAAGQGDGPGPRGQIQRCRRRRSPSR